MPRAWAGTGDWSVYIYQAFGPKAQVWQQFKRLQALTRPCWLFAPHPHLDSYCVLVSAQGRADLQGLESNSHLSRQTDVSHYDWFRTLWVDFRWIDLGSSRDSACYVTWDAGPVYQGHIWVAGFYRLHEGLCHQCTWLLQSRGAATRVDRSLDNQVL